MPSDRPDAARSSWPLALRCRGDSENTLAPRPACVQRAAPMWSSRVRYPRFRSRARRRQHGDDADSGLLRFSMVVRRRRTAASTASLLQTCATGKTAAAASPSVPSLPPRQPRKYSRRYPRTAIALGAADRGHLVGAYPGLVKFSITRCRWSPFRLPPRGSPRQRSGVDTL